MPAGTGWGRRSELATAPGGSSAADADATPAGGEETSSSAAPEESAPEGPEASEDPTPELGSRENPFPIDRPVGNDFWDIVLEEPHQAWQQVQQENMFNDPPADGMEYWILPVSVTYIGTETGDPFWDLEFGFVSDEGRSYDDDCGVIPDDLHDVGEMYSDAEASANICLTVPEGAPGLWTVGARFSEPVFFTTTGR